LLELIQAFDRLLISTAKSIVSLGIFKGLKHVGKAQASTQGKHHASAQSQTCRHELEEVTLKRLTVVDDDRDIRELLKAFLEKNGFEVTAYESGEALLDNSPQATDLLILDVGLPGIDGLELCRQLRQSTDLPIIMLTAADDDIDRILGLELGADDYMGKPFNPRELLARVKALLRRATNHEEVRKDEGELQIDIYRREVSYSDKPITLTGAEFDLLALFYENQGQIVSRDFLHQQLKGHPSSPFGRSIDTLVSRLRAKLVSDMGIDPIKSIRGKGYQLVVK